MVNGIEKRKSKVIEIDKSQLQKVKLGDILFKNLPPAVINLSNDYGQVVLESVTIKMRHTNDWRNLRYFYDKLLPHAIPPPLKTKRKQNIDNSQQRSYHG